VPIAAYYEPYAADHRLLTLVLLGDRKVWSLGVELLWTESCLQLVTLPSKCRCADELMDTTLKGENSKALEAVTCKTGTCKLPSLGSAAASC
jgi:hypothetical protein